MKTLFVLASLALFLEASGRCPNCPYYHTCCTSILGYGCCPLRDGNCCNIFTCCPSGYRCTGTPLCLRAPEIDDVLPVECENGNYYCPPHTKCCPNEARNDGCCAFSESVHCEDGIHYCPPGTVCSKTENKCIGMPSMSNPSEYVLALSTASLNDSSLKMEMPWFGKAKSFSKPKWLPSKH